jgi:hypothetical protein
VADADQDKEETTGPTEPGDAISVSKAKLDALIAEVEGGRKAQSGFDRKSRQLEESRQQLQVLSGFNDLGDEEQKGVNNMAAYSRTLAELAGQAHSLNASDVRYLETLPWTSIKERAAEIAADPPGGASAGDILAGLKVSNGTASPIGSADVALSNPGGTRQLMEDQQQNQTRLLNEMEAAQARGDDAAARSIGQRLGMTV